MQNRVHELWATFDFLMPNFLGCSTSFANEFAKPITKGNLPDASAEAINLGMEKLKILHQQVLPFILRREKTQVLKELPPKCISVIPCEMSHQQRSLYEAFCNSKEARVSLAALQDALRQGTSSNQAQESDLNVGQDALKSLLFLRLLCTHPSLVERKLHQDTLSTTTSNLLELSGKFLALSELLRTCGIHRDEITAADNDTSLLYCRDDEDDETKSDSSNLLDSVDNVLSGNVLSSQMENGTGDSKCLLFAQFTQSLDVVEELLLKRYMPSLRYVRLDGRVPANKRTAIVNAFNDDSSIKLMLLTTRVGSLGLNLQTADTVIFLESDFNPFVDLQVRGKIVYQKFVHLIQYGILCFSLLE